MSREAISKYTAALKARRNGQQSTATGDTPFVDAKPEFYADGRLLIDDVRSTSTDYKQRHPPYGLTNTKGEAVSQLNGETTAQRWLELEQAMAATALHAFNETKPSAKACPYHHALRNLGGVQLNPVDGNENGLDRLREITAPGGMFAPATIVNILRRIPAMRAITAATSDPESLARASSRSLLQEPLHHPQQYAKPFIFCLADGYNGSDMVFRRDSFMPRSVITDYVQLQKTTGGQEIVGWSKPTTDFTLRAKVHVANRLEGSESDLRGDHVSVYPAGTRLGDIRINEPTIGCPGNKMAYEMWDQAIDVIVAEELWEASTH